MFAVAPVRVNLIGEHVDSNGGWVLPAAIDRHLVMAVAPRDDDRVRLATAGFDGLLEFDACDLAPGRSKDWGRNVRGVMAGLTGAGHAVPGFDACVASTMPVGGGLSSSAALEAATGPAGLALCGAEMSPFALAKLRQQAEHDYAGVPCGIMDQAAVLCCEADHLLLFDCESESFVQTPFGASGWCLLIINSGVSHELARGEYAQRRAACEQAARRLPLASLRHLDPASLERSCRRYRRSSSAREQLVGTGCSEKAHGSSSLERMAPQHTIGSWNAATLRRLVPPRRNLAQDARGAYP